MTTLSTHEPAATRLHPAAAGVVGAVTFGLAMVAGDVFDLNKDDDTVAVTASEWLITGGIALVGLAIGVGLGLRAWHGDATRLSRTALGLAIAGGVTFVAFWSGWPSVFSAVAVGLALEHRRRIGSFSTSTGIAVALGVITFVATAFICVTG